MFIKGISYWSFPRGLDGSKPVREAMREAKKAGFESIELCLGETGDVSLTSTGHSIAEVTKAAHEEGIRISSVACGLFWGKSLSAPDPKVRAEAIDIGKKLIDVAAWMDAGAVLIIPGAVDVFFDPTSEVVDYNTVWELATDSISQLVGSAESSRIALCLENVWNKFLVGPVELCKFIDQFESDWVGSYFDVGNAMLVGYPEHWIRVLGSRIKRVHLKDFRRAVGDANGFCDLLSGDVNWPEVIAALQGIGYDSYLTAEMIPLYRFHPEVLIENTSRAIDAILRK